MSQKAYAAGSTRPALASGTLRLYSMRFCPFAKRVRLVLAYKNISYETVNIDLKKKPEWFLEDFPSGQVPALEWGDNKLNESIVISDYLDAAYPQNPLHSTDPYTKAQDQLLMSSFSKITQCLISYKVLGAESGEVKETIQPAIAHMQHFEKELGKRNTKFFGGNRPGMLDLMIWPWFDTIVIMEPVVDQISLDVLVPQAKCPAMRKWVENMQMIPAVKECRKNSPQQEQYYRLQKEGIIDPNVGL